MRVLLATYTGAGHMLPMSRLADRLRDAAHEPVLLSADEGAGGRRYATVPPPPPGRFEDNIDEYREVLFGRALAAEVRDVAAEVGAAVVIADALVPAALCGAHASDAVAVTLLNLPYGRLRAELLAGTGWWGAQLSRLNDTRAALGLAPYASALASWELAERMLLLGIEELEDPGTSVPAHLRFVGPCIPLPAQAPPASGRPRVVVALSSSDMAHGDALQAVLAALAALDLDVVATTAGALDSTTLGVPDNCELHEWLPMPEALIGASAIVTHAGHGTVMSALAASTPMVCVPLGRDQPFTAARIAALGAGVVATPTTAGQAVATVLGEPRFGHAAARLRDRLASLAGAAAAEVSRLATRRRATRW